MDKKAIIVNNLTNLKSIMSNIFVNTMPTDSLAWYYSDITMSVMASQITSSEHSIVCSIIFSGANQRKRQSSASLAFVRGIHQWLVDSPHKEPVVQKMFWLMTSWWEW